MRAAYVNMSSMFCSVLYSASDRTGVHTFCVIVKRVKHSLYSSIVVCLVSLIADFHIICKLAASVWQKCKQLLCIDIVICNN